MITREFTGTPLTWVRIAPANTVTTVPEGLWKYKELEIGYDSGDFAFLEGHVITGATSGAMGIVRSCTVATGTVGGGNAAGMIRFHSWNGINFTDNEKIKVAADTDVGDINGSVPAPCPDEYQYKNVLAKSVLVVAETYAQRLAFSAKKILTDQTSVVGIPLAAGGSILISDPSSMKNINVVDATAGSAGSSIFIGFF